MTNSLHSDAQSLDTQSSASNLDEMRKVVASLPKVLLHDHLDGGLRPQTVIDLAADCGYTDQLPTTDVDELEKWFIDTGNSGSLPSYLTACAHTCAVMQTAESLTRVAREAVEDLAADNVVYAELRLAPENHLEKGLDMQAVIDALVNALLFCCQRRLLDPINSHFPTFVTELKLRSVTLAVLGPDTAIHSR